MVDKSDFAFMSWSQGPLANHGLGDFQFPIPQGAFAQVFADGGEVSLAQLLYWLQLYSEAITDDWKAVEGPMDTLIDMIAPADHRAMVYAYGDNVWRLALGPVDLGEQVATIQRQDELLCAIRPDGDGGLVAAAFRPLDARSALLLMSAAQAAGPDGRVCMRENNWQYLLDQTASTGQMYACFRGEAYLALWKNGIGLGDNGEIDAACTTKARLVPGRPAKAAAQLGVFWTYDERKC